MKGRHGGLRSEIISGGAKEEEAEKADEVGGVGKWKKWKKLNRISGAVAIGMVCACPCVRKSNPVRPFRWRIVLLNRELTWG